MIQPLSMLFALTLAGAALAQPSADTALPPDGEYVTVRDGHLFTGGRRVRYWGAIGNFPSRETRDGRDPYADNEMLVKRFKDLGFNMVRLWDSPRGDYVKGDRSPADISDHFVSLCKKHGLRIWLAGLNRSGAPRPEDVDIVSDPATAKEWQEAVAAAPARAEGGGGRRNLARIWDRRLEAIGIRGRTQVGNHRNQWTGLRWADDPVFGIFELSNEEWWFGHMIAGEWQTQHPFFQKELLQQWNAFLQRKYKSEELLRQRWLGLLPGESLRQGTIALAPLRGDTNVDPQRIALGVNEKAGVAQRYSRADFNGHRASDVIEFLLEIWIGHKQREADAWKAMGKAARLSPLTWDTGIGYEIQAQYMLQHGDAIAHDTYIGGTHHDPTARRFPFMSGLEELPRLCWDRPWVEQNRFEGKPYLVYETQIRNSSKYRAEYPMRIASLGSIQDWDAVCWHYYGVTRDVRDPRPYQRPLDVGHSQELHYQYDEVQLSAMKAAAEIFRNFALAPAPKPTQFIFGRRALLDPGSMDYGGSYGEVGKMMMPTTYRYGVRLRIDPTLDDRPDDPLFRGPDGKPDQRKYRQFVSSGSMVIGPSYKPRVFEPNPVKPNSQITYDWQKGFLRFDSPAAAMFTGFLAEYGPAVSFQNGVRIRDVRVVNPPGMPYPVGEDEKYVAIAVTSADGKPLAECRRAVISAVSTSFNSGFKMEPPEAEFFGGKVERGTLPVLVARVGATIEAPALKGMKYRFFDWHMREIGQGTVGAGGVLKVPAGQPVFCIELER